MPYQTHSIRGAFTTYDADSTALNTGGIFRVRDIMPDVPFNRPYSATFWKFLDSLPKGKPMTQDKVEFGEQQMTANFVTVNSSVAAGDTEIQVTDAYNCVPGDRLFNFETGEEVRLDAVNSSVELSVALTTGYGRGFAGTTAAAMSIGDRLYKMGNALTEKGRTPQVANHMPKSDHNYSSIYIKAVSATKQQQNSIMLGNFGSMSEGMANGLFDFRREMNLDLWKGKRALIVVSAASAHDEGGGNLYQMNGFDEQVHSHVFDMSDITQMTWELWNEIASPCFTNDGGDRIAHCGQNTYSSIVNCARGNVVPTTYESVVKGVDVTAIAVDGGTLHLVKDYDGLPPGSMRIWHPGYIEWRERQGYSEQWIMNTKLPTQVQEDVNTLLAGGTLLVYNEEVHAKIDGIGGWSNRGMVGNVA